jgi:hypothetical protein
VFLTSSLNELQNERKAVTFASRTVNLEGEEEEKHQGEAAKKKILSGTGINLPDPSGYERGNVLLDAQLRLQAVIFIYLKLA